MSNTMIGWVLAISALGTFLLRYSFLWLSDRYIFPKHVVEWLKLIPATAIAALIIPALIATPSVFMQGGIAKLGATAIAILTMWLLRSATWTLLLGMMTFWIIEWFIH